MTQINITDDKPEIVEDSVATKILISPEKPDSKLPSRRLLMLLLALALVVGLGSVFATQTSKTTQTSTPNPAAVSQTVAPALGVEIALIEGLAEYSEDGETWQKLVNTTVIDEGKTLRTASDGRLVLNIDDGSAIRLDKDSWVKLVKLRSNEIKVTNIKGSVYSRVAPLATRAFLVSSGQDTYKALGTAFRTTNSSTKNGVEVFESKVEVVESKLQVDQGNQYIGTNNGDKKLAALDSNLLKSDEFVKWNAAKDKTNPDYSSKLGYLTTLDEPAPTPATPTTPTVTSPSAAVATAKKITLSGSVKGYDANFSWTNSGVDVSSGFKLVKSKTSSTPTYPNDSPAYIEAGKTSYSQTLGDGITYYFRICAYRGSTCESYSNTVTLTTPVKPEPQVVSGAVTLAITGTNASWTFAGTAPNGFKLVMNTAGQPTYPNDSKQYVNGTSTGLPGDLVSGTTYFVKVCKYTGSGCTDYSNEVTYIAP